MESEGTQAVVDHALKTGDVQLFCNDESEWMLVFPLKQGEHFSVSQQGKQPTIATVQVTDTKEFSVKSYKKAVQDLRDLAGLFNDTADQIEEDIDFVKRWA